MYYLVKGAEEAQAAFDSYKQSKGLGEDVRIVTLDGHTANFEEWFAEGDFATLNILQTTIQGKPFPYVIPTVYKNPANPVKVDDKGNFIVYSDEEACNAILQAAHANGCKDFNHDTARGGIYSSFANGINLEYPVSLTMSFRQESHGCYYVFTRVTSV